MTRSVVMYAVGLALLLLAAGCKLQVVVPPGGNVVTGSGSYECHAGQTCNIDIYDTYFDETFNAVPAEGFEFSGWKKHKSGFCGGLSVPCPLSTSGFAEHAALMTIIESDEVFYLEPVFTILPGCHGSDSSQSGKKITLQQGEYAVREIQVKVVECPL